MNKINNKPCACCGKETIAANTIFHTCPVCNWQDDEIQNRDPTYWGGANTLSLNLAKKIWLLQRPVECHLCGYKTLNTSSVYEKCPICGWIDDPTQSTNSENANGANKMSLDFAIRAWHTGQSFGLLKGEGWDERTGISEDEIMILEECRKFPLELQECPCCGQKNLLSRKNNETCGICEWIDDPSQSTDSDLEDGINEKSLNQARKDWEKTKDSF